MVSIGRLPEKERRKFRRANHVARDLSSGKYRQRVIPNKKNKDWDENIMYDDNVMMGPMGD
jgi:hypothetical protein